MHSRSVHTHKPGARVVVAQNRPGAFTLLRLTVHSPLAQAQTVAEALAVVEDDFPAANTNPAVGAADEHPVYRQAEPLRKYLVCFAARPRDSQRNGPVLMWRVVSLMLAIIYGAYVLSIPFGRLGSSLDG